LGTKTNPKKRCSQVLTAILVVIHVAASMMLILFILLHAGRGGGVSEMFGGGMQSQAMGSTVMEKNLDRITIVTAIVFTGTTVLLAFRLAP
jgi:preprotein translocase subunit SecG